MNRQRWVVLGLAHPRAAWFSELARWATSATIPVEFVKCMSANELRARLSAGRAYSALLVGDRVSGFDRDLVDAATTAGTTVIVVDPVPGHDWSELGVAGVVQSPLSREELLSTLEQHATPVEVVTTTTHPDPGVPEGSWRGRLIAVTGPGGAGKSTTAMAAAQALGSERANHDMVLLADFDLNGEQAMLHDARDVIPGVQELVDAHRTGRMTVDRTRSMVFDTGNRGYHLLLGLRRHRDWTVLRRRSFEAALDTLLRSYRTVVADVSPDFEGERETGSLDIAERNLMARSTLDRADIIIAVGAHGMKGIHSLALTLRELLSHEIEPARMVTVINRAPRNPARRSDDTKALAALVQSATGAHEISSPLFLTDRKDLESALRDGVRLPPALTKPIGNEISRRLNQAASRSGEPFGSQPELVAPGSLGSWTEEAG